MYDFPKVAAGVIAAVLLMACLFWIGWSIGTAIAGVLRALE